MQIPDFPLAVALSRAAEIAFGKQVGERSTCFLLVHEGLLHNTERWRSFPSFGSKAPLQLLVRTHGLLC